MTQAALGYLKRQYLCVLRRCIARNAMMTLSIASLAGGVAAQSIVPDGRTQTQIQTDGSVSHITTGTVHGSSAFNSFHRFNVDPGQVVNLHLPGQASHLLNLVTGERSYINGLVNSYQSGQIGGHVYFLNPHGTVVGAQGALNVGSLTLASPTSDFLDRLLSAGGQVNEQALADALAGRMPLSASGLIGVAGTVQAADAVTLAGEDIQVLAGASVTAGGAVPLAFGQLVNIQGVDVAGAVQMDGGTIRLLASGDIGVAGQLRADGVGTDSDGGTVVVMAQGTSTLASGAVLSANAGTTGDGGFVEFSARESVVLAGGRLEATAQQGVGGQVLIDPEQITVAADLLRQAGGNPSGAGVTWDAGSLTLQADERITVNEGVVISTRQVAGGSRNDHIQGPSTGASGDLTLKAAHIELREGSQLLAHGDHGHAGGHVALIAADINAFGAVRDAQASITASGATITGGEVTLRATADTSGIVALLEQTPNISEADAQAFINSELDDPADGPGAEYYAITNSATATTTLAGTRIEASGDVTVEARAGARAGFEKTATASVTLKDFERSDNSVQATEITGRDVSVHAASDTSLTFNVLGNALRLADQSWLPAEDSGEIQLLNDQLFDFSSVPLVALSRSSATVSVEDSTSLAASRDLSVTAQSVSAAKPTFASPLLFSAAWGESYATARVRVDGDSLLRAARAAHLGAETEVELNVSASVNSTNKPIDVVFARSLSDITTEVTVGDGVTVEAGSLSVHADTKADITLSADASNTGGSGLGIAVAVNESTSSTTARLGGTIETSQADVDVKATTNIEQNSTTANAATLGNPNTLAARAANLQAGIQRNVGSAMLTATGKVDAGTANTLTTYMFPGVKEGKFNASGAVAWADSHNTAEATIAPAASVQSLGGIRVEASVSEAPNASATAQSTSTGTAVGGSAVVAQYANHANASIGSNAQVDARRGLTVEASTLIPYPWQINWSSPAAILNHLQGSLLDLVLTGYTLNSAKGRDGVGIAAGVSLLGFDNQASATIDEGAQVNQRINSTVTPAFDLSAQSVEVKAQNEVNLVTAAGIASKKFLGATGGKGAIGGVASLVDITGTAVAGIRDGAQVHASQAVSVDAQSQHRLVSVTEAGGSANSVSIEGAVSLTSVDTDTLAFVEDKAVVDAGTDITVQAGSDLRTIAVAGGVAATKGPVGIGMSVALNRIDNAVMAMAGNVNEDAGPATGRLTAGRDVEVVADAQTEIGAYSVAGAIATTSSGQTQATSTASTTQDGSSSAASTSSGAQSAGQGKFGIAMSGDASVNDITSVTEAAIEDGLRVTQARDVAVKAANQLAINAFSGAVTVSTQQQGNGIAGSYAQNTLGGGTEARVVDTELVLSRDLLLHAQTDGEIQTLSASLAAARGKAGVAGSVSVNQIHHDTQAMLGSSTVTGGASVWVNAQDGSTIRSVAGALAYGGKASVGLSFAWNEIGSNTSALVDTSELEVSGNARITASSEATIESISASLGASQGQMAGAGAVSINTIRHATEARVSGQRGDGLVAGDAVDIAAENDARLFALAGGVGATTGQAGLGAAVAWADVESTVDASIEQGARVVSTGAGVQVSGTSVSDIQALAAAGGAADKVAVAGSLASVETRNTTRARVVENSDVEALTTVNVEAHDDAAVESLAGSVAASGNAALGLGAAVNRIDNDTQAQVQGSRITAGAARVSVLTEASIDTAAVGGGGAAKVAATGSLNRPGN